MATNDKKKPRNRLYGVITREVSFVNKGAIRREFILAKRDEDAPLPEEIEKVGPPKAPAPPGSPGGNGPAMNPDQAAAPASSTPAQSYQIDDSAKPKKQIKLPKGAKEPMAKALKAGLEKYADLADTVYSSDETEDPYEAVPPQELIDAVNEIGEFCMAMLKAYPGLQLSYSKPSAAPQAEDSSPSTLQDPVQEALHMNKNETPATTDAGAEEALARIAKTEKALSDFESLLNSLSPVPAAPAAPAAPAIDIQAVVTQAVNSAVNSALAKAKEEFGAQTSAFQSQAQALQQQSAALQQQNALLQKQIESLKALVPVGRIASQQNPVVPTQSKPQVADVRGDLNAFFASNAASRRQ